MNYSEISKTTIQHLYQSYHSLKHSPIDASLRVLIELRVSQINGCVYCCNLHTSEAKNLGIAQEKIEKLTEWFISELFTAAEKSALGWCEAVTRAEKNVKDLRELLANYFSEREIVDLTACVALMSALNRLAISLRD